MPQDTTIPSLSSYVVRIDADSTMLNNNAGDRFAVRSGGVELLSVRETRHVWLGGTNTLVKNSATVDIEGRDSAAATAFDFQVNGTSKLTLGKTGPISVSKLVIEVVDYPAPDPTEAGQITVERRWVNGAWEYRLCVAALDGQLRWFKSDPHVDLS